MHFGWLHALSIRKAKRMKYVHTNIVSKDWKSLSNFYIKTFDCRIRPPVRDLSGDWLEKGTGIANARLKGVHLIMPGYGDNGPTLEIFQYDEIENQEAIRPNKRGFGHIAFEVDDIEAVLEDLVRNGGQRFGEIGINTIEGAGKIAFVYARDPEGNLIELQSWSKPERR